MVMDKDALAETRWERVELDWETAHHHVLEELLITALRRAERLGYERSRKRHQETGTPVGPGAR